MPKRIDPRNLVLGRFAFIAQDGAVKLVGVFPQTFFTGDRTAFSRCDDYLTHHIHLACEIRDGFTRGFVGRNSLLALGEAHSQRHDAIHQGTFVCE